MVFVEQAQRRIPVQYAKRMVGRRMYGGTSTYIPLKVNQAGVIPVIFASSLLYLPQLISQLPGNETSGWRRFIEQLRHRPEHPVYIALYFALIVFFTYFYVSITFNPKERRRQHEEVRRLHPGHPARPARPRSTWTTCCPGSRCPARSTWASSRSCRTSFLALDRRRQQPELPVRRHRVLIMVGVGLDTVKQIESQLQQRNYEGFLPLVRLVLVGPPGAGKGTQAQFIASHFGDPQDLAPATSSGPT